MARKVNLAIIDNDLRVKVNKYPVSDDGTKIRVVSGGEAHFMPKFDNDSFIEFPRKFLFLNIGWDRMYFAKKGAKQCVNFKNEEVFGPDIEQLKQSLGSSLLDKLGQEKPPFPTWMIYAILMVVVGIAMKVFGMI